MVTSPKSGDKVAWSSHGGEAHGKVVRKLIKPTKVKGHKVAASTDNPEFSWKPTMANTLPTRPAR